MNLDKLDEALRSVEDSHRHFVLGPSEAALTVMEAARAFRDQERKKATLGEMAEKKRATLGEIEAAVVHAAIGRELHSNDGALLREAAAVLRRLDKFKTDAVARDTYDTCRLAQEFMRDVP